MSKIIFGIDVGGTTCKCGTFSKEGELLRKEEIPTRKDEGGSLILPDISEYIKGVLADMNMTTEDVAGIGMGLPGACLEDGTVNKCINLGWGVFNAANALSELTGIPVKIGNDANMAALGEFWVGGGSEYNSMVMVTIGLLILIRGLVLLLAATVVIGMTPLKSGAWWQESAGARMSTATLGALKPLLPEDFSSYLP